MASVSLPIPAPAVPTVAHRARRRLGSLLLTIAFVIALFMAGSKLIGFNRYVITGKSMTGSISMGSIAYDRLVPTSSLKVGDVITYVPPKVSGVHHLVTHRIIWIGRDVHGRRIYRTKGDNNPVADPWNKFTLGREVPRVVFHVPYAGYALTQLGRPRARLVLIGLPAILIALAVLAGLWEDAGREAQRERAGGLEGAA